MAVASRMQIPALVHPTDRAIGGVQHGRRRRGPMSAEEQAFEDQAWWDRLKILCSPEYGNHDTVLGQPLPDVAHVLPGLDAELEERHRSGELAIFASMQERIWASPERYDPAIALFTGVGPRSSMVVPAVFWSAPWSFRRALIRLAHLYLPKEGRTKVAFNKLLLDFAIQTAMLRSELWKAGHFVGWVPLDEWVPTPDQLARNGIPREYPLAVMCHKQVAEARVAIFWPVYLERWWREGINTGYAGPYTPQPIFFHSPFPEDLMGLCDALPGVASQLCQRGVRGVVCHQTYFAPVWLDHNGIRHIDHVEMSAAFNACARAPDSHRCHERRHALARASFPLPAPTHPCGRILYAFHPEAHEERERIRLVCAGDPKRRAAQHASPSQSDRHSPNPSAASTASPPSSPAPEPRVSPAARAAPVAAIPPVARQHPFSATRADPRSAAPLPTEAPFPASSWDQVLDPNSALLSLAELAVWDESVGRRG